MRGRLLATVALEGNCRSDRVQLAIKNALSPASQNTLRP